MEVNSQLYTLATLLLQVHSTHRPECLVGLEAGLDTSKRTVSYSSQKLRHKSSVAPPIALLYQQR